MERMVQMLPPSSQFRKIFAIGDIHGCYGRLVRLLEKLPFDRERDLLVFLGDYINRGSESKEVISHLCTLKKNGINLVPIMGNHEYLLMEYQKSADPAMIPMLRQLQIDLTMKSYGLIDMGRLKHLEGLPEEHRQFFADLSAKYISNSHVFVHAGLYPGIPIEKQDFESLYEMRGVFLESEYDFGKVVVFGHTSFRTPLVTSTKIGIDTGAVYDNMLTALELPAMVFHHA